MSEQQRKNSLLRSSISINSIRRTASQFTKSLERSNIIAKDIIKTTKDRNLFERNTTAKDNEYFRKRRENIKRKQREDELEASSITGVTKREGTVTAKSTKGFLGRILDFFGIILIGWFVTKLPGIIKAIGNVINVIKKAVGFLTGFIDGIRDFLTGIGDGIRAAIDALPKFDFDVFKFQTDKTLKETEQTTKKLEQDLFFATREAIDSFEQVITDNPDIDPNTGELIYDEKQEKQLRGGTQAPTNEGEGETEGTDGTMIASASTVSIGDSSNVEGTSTTVGEEEIKLGDDETNNKISEAVDKLEASGKRLEKTGEDEETKQLSSKIQESTAGVGGGESGGTGGGTGGGTQEVTGAKSDINEKNVKLNDKKEEEIQEDETEGEKGEPIINKRGRIIGYKKVDPAIFIITLSPPLNGNPLYIPCILPFFPRIVPPVLITTTVAVTDGAKIFS
tara:strand:+ start:4833 stop:6185 length:1353 start_codon:yes stop_codon:yes gene_type:complete